MLLSDFNDALHGLSDFRYVIREFVDTLAARGLESTQALQESCARIEVYMFVHIRVITPLVTLAEKAQGDIEPALEASDMLRCSDPRDYLYALLSIDTGCDVEPDYTISAAAAYTRFAELLIQRKRACVLFRNIQPLRTKDEVTAGLPSWVPDLRRPFAVLESLVPNSNNFNAFCSGSRTLSCTLPFLGDLAYVRPRESLNGDVLWQVSLQNIARVSLSISLHSLFGRMSRASR